MFKCGRAVVDLSKVFYSSGYERSMDGRNGFKEKKLGTDEAIAEITFELLKNKKHLSFSILRLATNLVLLRYSIYHKSGKYW